MAPIARAEPFSLCAQDRGIRRKLRQRGGQLGGLTGEHRQNLPFETVIAERHAMEMVEIDRPILRNQGWRGHPVDLSKRKRHCCYPGIRCDGEVSPQNPT